MTCFRGRAHARPASRALLFVLTVLTALGCVAEPTPTPMLPRPLWPSADTRGVGAPVSVVVSSAAGDRMTERDDLVFSPRTVRSPDLLRFTVNDPLEFQRVVGFGASFLEAGLVTLNTLPTRDEQDAVLRMLFDPIDGAGFSAMKTVLGGTDFQSAFPEWFTYADVRGPDADPLANFSIERDLQPDGLIPYIRRAREAGGDFVLQATMDFPPDWMLVELGVDHNVSPAHYEDLAEYYVRYLEAYEAEGIHVDYLSLFNEPFAYTHIPGPDMHVVLRDHVGPAFERAGLTNGIMLGEVWSHQWAREWYTPILDDPEARRFVGAMGYHTYDLYFYSDIAWLSNRYPDIPIWQTEACCKVPRHVFEWQDGGFWADVVFEDLENQTAAWLYWNMILDEGGGPWLISPVHGDPDLNRQPALVTIDRTTHEVNYTGVFWHLAHFSRYVRPGALRVDTSPRFDPGLGHLVRAITFLTPTEDELVMQVLNRGEATTIEVEWAGGLTEVALAPSSITTLRWPRTP